MLLAPVGDAGKPLAFRWAIGGVHGAEARAPFSHDPVLPDGATEADYGVGDSLWEGPVIGREWQPPTAASLKRGDFVVVETEEDDHYAFEEDGVFFYLGVVR